jgi:hypothetical protein
VDSEDLPSLLRTSLEYPLEYPLLGIKAWIELGSSVQPHLSNVSSLLKQALQERQLRFALGHQLRM